MFVNVLVPGYYCVLRDLQVFVYMEGIRVQPRVDNICLTIAICNPEYSNELNTALRRFTLLC